MCVIIYIPKESTISENELTNAWLTNPDGAGYSIQKDDKVYFKRGFMNLKDFLEEVLPLVGLYNLLLHFRISTSKSVNKIQTHPYKKGNVSITEGSTTKPVICMNGIISGQTEYKHCNDTMSYIIDHASAFSRVNQDILNIIESDTGSKWAVMKPDEVLLSSKFVESEGRFYSNKNHLWRSRVVYKRKTNKFNKMIKSKSLRDSIRKNKELYEDVTEFIDYWCNSSYDLCTMCTKCLKTANTLRDVKITLNENYYYEPQYELDDNSEEYNNCCTLDYFVDENNNKYYDNTNCNDYWYDDVYNYNNIFDE